MTAREELIDALRPVGQDALEREKRLGSGGFKSAEYQALMVTAAIVDALTPDLWLRYGLEMGWVEKKSYYYCFKGAEKEVMCECGHFDAAHATDTDECTECDCRQLQRAGAEKKEEEEE